MIVGYHLREIGENSEAIGRVLSHPCLACQKLHFTEIKYQLVSGIRQV